MILNGGPLIVIRCYLYLKGCVLHALPLLYPSSLSIGVRTGVARWAMAPPNASAGAPRRAVNAGSTVKVGRGP